MKRAKEQPLYARAVMVYDVYAFACLLLNHIESIYSCQGFISAGSSSWTCRCFCVKRRGVFVTDVLPELNPKCHSIAEKHLHSCTSHHQSCITRRAASSHRTC